MAGEVGDKSVRLSFVVDEASLQRARSAIGELIADTTRLAEVLRHTSIGGHGGGNTIPGLVDNKGGGGGGGMSLLSGGAVGGGASQQQLLAGGVDQRLTQSLVNNRDILKNLAAGSADAMKVMSDSLKRAVDSQKREIEGLQAKAKDLLETYKEVGRSDATPKIRDYKQKRIAEELIANEQAIGQGKENLKDLKESERRISPGFKDPKEPAPGGTGAGAIDALMSKLGKLATGAFVYQGLQAAANEYVNAPSRQLGAAAQRAAVWSDVYRGARGGDLTYVAAAAGLGGMAGMPGREYSGDFRDQDAQGRDIVRRLQSGAGGIAGLLKMDVGGLIQKGLYGGISDVQTQTDIMKQKRQMMDQVIASDPLFFASLQQFQGQAEGMTAMAHATGMGWSGRPGQRRADFQRRLISAQMHGGFSDAEFMGAFSGIQGVGGRRAAQSGLTEMAMGGEAGGFLGAGGIAGLAAQGGRGREFMQAMFASGLDPVAAARVAQAVAGGIGAGGILSSGVGALDAFSQMGGTGSAADMLQARKAQEGLGAMSGVMGGTLDKYQAGINFLNAGQAFGNVGFGAQSALSKVFGQNPTLALDIISGKQPIPEELRSMGVTSIEQVKQYFNASSGSAIARASNIFGGETRAGRTLQAIQSSGLSAREYMLQQEKGMGAKAKAAFEKALVSDVGVGFAESQGISITAGEGEAQGFLFGGAAGKRRRGARFAIGEEGKLVEEEGAVRKKNLESMEANVEVYHQIAKSAPAAMQAFGTAATNLAGSADGVTHSFEALQKAAMAAAIAMLPPGMRADVNAALNQYHSRKAFQEAISGATGAKKQALEFALQEADAEGTLSSGPRGPSKLEAQGISQTERVRNMKHN
jgi:hypothetical protein